MKIIELQAENVLRLKAVDITPDGTLQVIGGRNAQGKSSVLNAIFLAIGGGKAGKATVQPIRDGEERAYVRLDLGELVVTRTWTKGGATKLTVTSADGASYKSPQSMLDALVGHLSFDPLAFTRLSARDQREALLDLVDLDVDLDALDNERDRLYENRTQVGRDGKAIGDVEVDDTLPDDEQSASELIKSIREKEEHNSKIRAARRNVIEIESHISDLEQQLIKAKSELNEAAWLANAELAETDHLEDQLATIEETNARIRDNQQAQIKQVEKDGLRGEYDDLTRQIEALDKRKADALVSAEFPIEGLAFDENGVTYQGVPFSQASSAEQIKVSLAMAMALNPDLKVLRIMDGSLLDDESMEAIREVVAENDYQLWLERVGDADQGAVILEDGEVAE